MDYIYCFIAQQSAEFRKAAGKDKLGSYLRDSTETVKSNTSTQCNVNSILVVTNRGGFEPNKDIGLH